MKEQDGPAPPLQIPGSAPGSFHYVSTKKLARPQELVTSRADSDSTVGCQQQCWLVATTNMIDAVGWRQASKECRVQVTSQ